MVTATITSKKWFTELSFKNSGLIFWKTKLKKTKLMLNIYLNKQTFATGRGQFWHVTERNNLQNSSDFPEIIQLANNEVRKE